MANKDWFMLNGVLTDTLENIKVNTPEIPPFASRKVSMYDVGSDEIEAFSDDTYENVPYSLTFFSFGRTFDTTDIYAFLADAKTLIVSRTPQYYYKIRSMSMATPELSYDGYKVKYRLNFQLAPFRYAVENPFTDVSHASIITNNGSRYCKPIIEVTGQGDITIQVNPENVGTNQFTLHLGDAEKTVIADSERELVYQKSDNKILWNISSGYFPILPPGNNQILYSDTSLTTKIKKNERWY